MISYSTKFLLSLYKNMLRIRIFEESLVDPILKGEIKTPCHLCTGQEAVAVGVCSALKEGDQIFGNHRSHGHYLAMGGGMNKLAAEIYGKENGCSKGRGGSMHIIDAEKGVMGCVPIVAGTISLAVGAALAKKIKGEDGIVVSFFGDGACGEGVLYESLNFAVLHELPIIFVCENNYYATHMKIGRSLCNTWISDLIAGFGIHRDTINGNDVLMVYDYAKSLKSLPYFLECETYRLRGHVGPDDNILGKHQDIRPPKEIQTWKQKDPIKQFAKYLYDTEVIDRFNIADGEESPNKLLLTEWEVQQEVKAAHAFAKANPWPKREELERYVYA